MATAGQETASAGRMEGTTEEPGTARGRASRGRAEEEEGGPGARGRRERRGRGGK